MLVREAGKCDLTCELWALTPSHQPASGPTTLFLCICWSENWSDITSDLPVSWRRSFKFSLDNHKLWMCFDPHLTPDTWGVLCKVKLNLSTNVETWWLMEKKQKNTAGVCGVWSFDSREHDTSNIFLNTVFFFLFKRILIQTFVHWWCSRVNKTYAQTVCLLPSFVWDM